MFSLGLAMRELLQSSLPELQQELTRCLAEQPAVPRLWLIIWVDGVVGKYDCCVEICPEKCAARTGSTFCWLVDCLCRAAPGHRSYRFVKDQSLFEHRQCPATTVVEEGRQ